MPVWMSSVNDLVLVQGMHDTKLALRRWNDHPWQMLRPWAALSLLISGALRPEPMSLSTPGRLISEPTERSPR